VEEPIKVREYAQMTGMDPSTVYDYIRRGKIVATPTKPILVFPEATKERWLEQSLASADMREAERSQGRRKNEKRLKPKQTYYGSAEDIAKAISAL